MRLRVTLVLDRTLTEQDAFDKYRTFDPQVVASEMQREAQQMAADMKRDGLEVAGVHVQAIYGS